MSIEFEEGGMYQSTNFGTNMPTSIPQYNTVGNKHKGISEMMVSHHLAKNVDQAAKILMTVCVVSMIACIIAVYYSINHYTAPKVLPKNIQSTEVRVSK